MRADWAISGVGHAAILLLGLVSLASSKPQDDSNLIPVTIVTDADISRAALGQQDAPPVPKPKPLVDKIGEPKPPQQLAPKVTEKPEITTSTTPPMPQPKPEPKQEAKSEPKPDPKPEPKPKPDPKAVEKPNKKPDDFKPDQIADLLNKKDAQKAYRDAAKADPKVGTSDVFCRLLLCDAHDIGIDSDFLHKNRWLLAPPLEP